MTNKSDEIIQDILHCLEWRWIVLSSLLLGIMVISVYPFACVSMLERQHCHGHTYPKSSREVNFKGDFLMTSRDENVVRTDNKVEIYEGDV